MKKDDVEKDPNIFMTSICFYGFNLTQNDTNFYMRLIYGMIDDYI